MVYLEDSCNSKCLLNVLECLLFLVTVQFAEEKRAEIWRANCPELRQVEVRQREKAMPSAWQEQVTAKTQVSPV